MLFRSVEPIVEVTAITREELLETIIGIWHNDAQMLLDEWAYNYHTTFYDDYTVEHFGHRNFDKGTYGVSDDGEIYAVFDECRYDFPGFNWTDSTPGYECVFKLTDDGGLMREPSDRESWVFEQVPIKNAD